MRLRTSHYMLLFLIAFALYMPRAATSVQPGDAGEFAAASYMLSLPHPTGAVPFLLIAHLWSLVPLGEIAYRVSVLSALLSALTIALTAFTCRRFLNGKSSSGPFIAGIVLLLAPHFWFQALRAEVYPCANLFGLLVLISITTNTIRLRNLLVSSYLTALTVTIHPLLALGSIVVLIKQHVIHVRRVSWFCYSGLLFLIGLGSWIFLPLRSASESIVSRDLSTLPSFVHYITGKGYGSNLGFQLPENGGTLLLGMLLNLPVFSILFALIGLYHGIRTRKRRIVNLMCYLSGALLPFVFYSIPDILEYISPIIITLSLSAGIGIDSLWTRMQGVSHRQRTNYVLLILFVLLLIIPTLLMDMEFNAAPDYFLDRSNDYKTWRLTTSIAQGLTPDSEVFADWTQGCAFWYCNRVCKLPDEKIPLHLSREKDMLNWRASIQDKAERTVLLVRRPDLIPRSSLTVDNFGYRINFNQNEMLFADFVQTAIQAEEPLNAFMELWQLRNQHVNPDSFLILDIVWQQQVIDRGQTVILKLFDAKGYLVSEATFSPMCLASEAGRPETYWIYIPAFAKGDCVVELTVLNTDKKSILNRYKLLLVRIE